MATNDILPIAIAGGANVASQATYAASADVTNGFANGEIPASSIWNKMMRQASVMVFVLSQVMVNVTGVSIVDDGTTAGKITQLQGMFHTRLSANTTFFVSITGNDATGDGTVGNPWRTAQKASDVLQQKYDLNGFVATIRRQASTAYTDAVLVKGPYVGANDATSVVFDSSGGSATTTVTTAGNNYTFQSGARATVQGQKLISSAGGNFGVDYGSYLNYTDINFAGVAAGSNHVFVDYNGFAQCIGACTISAGGASHVALSLSAIWVCNAIAYTMSGTPVFTASFVNCQGNSTVNSSTSTFTGATTGTRYSASLNGVIQTSGGGANYFPGSVAGTTATGGQYV